MLPSPEAYLKGTGGTPSKGSGMGDFIGRSFGSSTNENYKGPYVSIKNESLDEFIRLVIDETTILNQVATVQLRGDNLELPNVNIAPGQMAGGLGKMEPIDGTANAQFVKPTYGGRTLTVKPFDLRYKYEETNFPRINIEREGMRSTIDELMRRYIGNETERISLNSRTSGIKHTSWVDFNTGNMTTTDGWFAKALSGAHILNVDPAGTTPYYVQPNLFKSMWQLLPTKWHARKDEFVFFVASNVEVEYNAFFSGRQTALGDQALVSGARTAWSGIPLSPIPSIPVDERHVTAIRPDTGSTEVNLTGPDYGIDQKYSWSINSEGEGYQTSDTELYTWVMLARPANLVLGYGPEFKVSRVLDNSAKFSWYNFWGQFGVEFFNIDEVVLAINVTPTIDPGDDDEGLSS